MFILPYSNGSTGIIFLNDERFFQSDIFGKNFQEKSVVHYPQGVRVDQLILDNTDKLFMVGNNKVYSSLDYGMTWELDTRFSQINVKKIFLFDDANRPVVFGTYLSQDGTYLIEDLNNYRLLSKGPNPVWYLGEERIGIIEETKGILYSEDYGETWNDITVDQPFDRSYRIPHFTSMFLDRDGYFYTSRKYEGVYKTVKPLVSTQDEILEEVAISPNPVRVYLSINLGEENSGNIQVQIMNLLGQTVWSGNMNGNQTRIQLTSLPLGMYSLKLIKEGHLVHSEKIVKQ
ncbi:MAG: T9SS type A sorting domain-containing protein [Saprospiraceae bacterium]|nr:T9SS type A sorting domain-containing protein [Saprospiraceae bacterium]